MTDAEREILIAHYTKLICQRVISPNARRLALLRLSDLVELRFQPKKAK